MSAKAGHLFSFSLTQLLEDIACWYMHKLFAKAEIFTVQLNSGIFFCPLLWHMHIYVIFISFLNDEDSFVCHI